MNKTTPKRLTNDSFFTSDSGLKIYHQTLSAPFELHWHEFYELTYIISGEGLNVVNGVQFPLIRGNLFLLTPADFHEICPLEGKSLELYNVIFSEELLGEELYDLLFNQELIHMVTLDQHAADLIHFEFQRIYEESQHKQEGYQLMIRGALEKILITLVRNRSYLKEESLRKNSQYSQHPAVQKALVYIHHHFREPLTLEDVAKQASLSPNYFSSCFRKMTGFSFQKYVQNLRLKFAKSLLSASNLPVTEVCYASGFHTLTHFERAFKQAFGKSPRTYQKKTVSKQ
jgi:AraC-like DNA-binding protein